MGSRVRTAMTVPGSSLVNLSPRPLSCANTAIELHNASATTTPVPDLCMSSPLLTIEGCNPCTLGPAHPDCPQSLDEKRRRLSGACTSSRQQGMKYPPCERPVVVVRLEPQLLAI